MENIAPPEPRAPARLTDDQAQELVLRTVATQAESLLRTAYHHSLCADDAHDAYQRSMEIFLRRAPTLDPASAHKWLHVVIKHEAKEVRRVRSEAVSSEDIDFDTHPAQDVSSPEERALTVDRTTRAAEALRRLKPQELRAMWLRAMGHSYAEIAEATGYSATKVNRCLAEGRKSFLARYEGIEAGVECERWQPVLSAMVDGEATAAQITEARPHLRNCPACRATLRGLHQAHRPLAAVLPLGLASAGAKLSGMFERLLPGVGVGSGDAVVAAGATTGGAGLLGLGVSKVAVVLATGAVAIGGGTVAVHHEHREHARQHETRVAMPTGAISTGSPMVAGAQAAGLPRNVATRRAGVTAPATHATSKAADATAHAAQVVGPGELKPTGHEVATSTLPSAAVPPIPAHGIAHITTSPKLISAVMPDGQKADSSAGEFAP
jgi:RNA polymerase sigma factor (sigma-70 family)